MKEQQKSCIAAVAKRGERDAKNRSFIEFLFLYCFQVYYRRYASPTMTTRRSMERVIGGLFNCFKNSFYEQNFYGYCVVLSIMLPPRCVSVNLIFMLIERIALMLLLSTNNLSLYP